MKTVQRVFAPQKRVRQEGKLGISRIETNIVSLRRESEEKATMIDPRDWKRLCELEAFDHVYVEPMETVYLGSGSAKEEATSVWVYVSQGPWT
jgi:hypothetical protein